MANLEQFLTVKQAAEFLGVAPNTLRNWDRDQKIPVYRHPISNYRLFKRDDLEEVLRQILESGASDWMAETRAAEPPKEETEVNFAAPFHPQRSREFFLTAGKEV